MAPSPGGYKGVEITPGTDAEVAAQMAKIDAGSGAQGTQGAAVPAPTAAPGTPSAAPTAQPQDEFIGQLQKSLLTQSGIVSSADSNISKSINEAIKGVNASNDASKAGIMSEYARNRGYQLDANKNSETGFMENRSGYATSVVGFSNLREYNAKSIKDLDQRKNELLMQGDAAAAGKVADLQLKKLDYEQAAAERTFNNLLGIGNFGLSVASGQREQRGLDIQSRGVDLQEKAQNFQEKSAMGAIALQYGIKIEPGDTIDSVVTRAQPFASQEEALKLEQVRSAIAQNRAQTQAALASAARSAREDRGLDPAQIAALATAYRNGGASVVAGVVKDPAQWSSIFAEASNQENADVRKYVQGKMSSGASLDSVLSQMQNDPSIPITNYGSAAQTAADIYSKKPAVPQRSISQKATGGLDSVTNAFRALMGEPPI